MGLRSWLLGGAVEAGVSSAGKINEIVERWFPNDSSRHDKAKELYEIMADERDSARQHDAALAFNTGVPILDALVNAVNRIIRPGVTIGLIGGLLGWWDLPDPETFDPTYFRMAEIVLVFWFGGRFLTKDAPAIYSKVKEMVDKRKAKNGGNSHD